MKVWIDILKFKHEDPQSKRKKGYTHTVVRFVVSSPEDEKMILGLKMKFSDPNTNVVVVTDKEIKKKTREGKRILKKYGEEAYQSWLSDQSCGGA